MSRAEIRRKRRAAGVHRARTKKGRRPAIRDVSGGVDWTKYVDEKGRRLGS